MYKTKALITGLALSLAATLTVVTGLPVEAQAPVSVHVAGAASLQPALHQVKETFEATHPARLVLHFASTGTLRHQIEWGAPIDLLLGVAGEATSGLIRRDLAVEVVEELAANRLVLVRPEGKTWPAAWDDLRASRGKRIAIGDPSHVPVGWYARQALRADGLWDDVLPGLVLGADARQVVTYVQRAVVDAAIVYASDLTPEGNGMEAVAVVPQNLHPPIRYAALVVRRTRTKHQEQALQALLQFLQGDQARAIFAAHGLGAAP